MPSATAIRGFAERTGQGATFDVTVSGKVDGKELTGWARVRQTSPGVVGTDPRRTRESAWRGSLLGARSPARHARAAHAGDSVQRHRKRAAAVGTRLQAVKSSWVDAIGYGPGQDVMVTKIRE